MMPQNTQIDPRQSPDGRHRLNRHRLPVAVPTDGAYQVLIYTYAVSIDGTYLDAVYQVNSYPVSSYSVAIYPVTQSPNSRLSGRHLHSHAVRTIAAHSVAAHSVAIHTGASFTHNRGHAWLNQPGP